jgi:hypothetical protein
MKPVGIQDLQEANISIPKLASDDNILEMIADEQILKILDENIPAQHRSTYLKLKHGDKVYKTDLTKLTTCIKQILKDHNYDT